jgi:hypothetical protein
MKVHRGSLPCLCPKGKCEANKCTAWKDDDPAVLADKSVRAYQKDPKTGVKTDKLSETYIIDTNHKKEDKEREGKLEQGEVYKPRFIQVFKQRAEVTVKIYGITDISTKTDSFSMDFVLMIDWFDPDIINGSFVVGENWHPRLTFDNQIDAIADTNLDESESDPRMADSGVGLAKITKRTKGTFKARFNVHDFPFDVHMLPVVIKTRSERQDRGKVEATGERILTHLDYGGNIRKGKPMMAGLVKDITTGKPVMTAMTFEKHADWLQEFDVEDIIVANDHDRDIDNLSYSHINTDEDKKKIIEDLKDAQKFTFGAIVRRDTNNVSFNITLSLFLIQSLTVTVWGLAPADFHDRSQNVLTIMLTVVAFKYMVSDRLPAVPYMTVMDVYIITGFIFLWVLGFSVWTISLVSDVEEDALDSLVSLKRLHRGYKMSTAAKLDIAMFCLSCVWCLGGLFYMFFLGSKMQRSTFKRWEQMAAKENYWRKTINKEAKMHVEDFTTMWASSIGSDILPNNTVLGETAMLKAVKANWSASSGTRSSGVSILARSSSALGNGQVRKSLRMIVEDEGGKEKESAIHPNQPDSD